jgi:hypothetical protein
MQSGAKPAYEIGAGSGGVQPPGLTSHPLARAMVVLVGRDAAPSRVNVRRPATAQQPRRAH